MPWSSVLITWGIFAVILVCLWFVMGKKEELRSRREMEDEMRQMEKMNPDLDDVIDKGVEDAESAGGDDDDDDAPVRPSQPIVRNYLSSLPNTFRSNFRRLSTSA